MILFMNGLINNIIIPIQSTLSNTYYVSGKVVNIPSIISFLIFSLVNIPINHLLDKRGIRFGLLLGNSIYLVGIAICCLINAAFPFLIIGYLIFSFGQPFIVNVPAKIAAYWFLPENVLLNLVREILQHLYLLEAISLDQVQDLPFQLQL